MKDFVWQGKELKTIGDLMDAMGAWKTAEEAQEFMRDFRAHTPHADENIGYLTGYFGRDDMMRLQEWSGAAHPIFGRSAPSPEEAFKKGVALGQLAGMDDSSTKH